MKIINVGLIGLGTVGCGVVKVFEKKSEILQKKLGIKLVLKRICDIDLTRPRDVNIDSNILTSDVNQLLEDDQIQIIIELIGGIHPAKSYVVRALKNKKYVVTANKALLAEAGEEIFNIARENAVDVYFEASVGGGIPIIKALKEGFVANQVEGIFGIINGTSNYILTQMSQKGCEFKIALTEAQKKGYAEKDPTLDIDGLDSAHKIAILAQLCFNQSIQTKDVFVEGIRDIDLSDIRYADELGFCVKLLAIAKKNGNELQLRVHPTLLSKRSLLAKINGVYNAILINADLVGECLFYGQGAGQAPTASAVMSDIVCVAMNISGEILADKNIPEIKNSTEKISSIDDLETRYYMRFAALDEPAVLSSIATILGKFGISIHSVIQKGRRQEQAVPIVMMTHEAKENNLKKALVEIDQLPVIKRKTVVIRVERN
ncbi:MAG: homoserine dehydrogenase [Candidatus Omnitrophota bacterium]